MSSPTSAPPQSLSPQEQRLLKLYGKIPSSSQLLNKKIQERKYFDSGDYALSKAATPSSPPAVVGLKHPSPATIPQRPSNSSSSATPRHNIASSPRRSSIVTTCVMNANDSLTA